MVEKVGRNDLCPCGSGKKYKLCHGAVRITPPVLYIHPAKQDVDFYAENFTNRQVQMGRPYGLIPLGVPALVNVLRDNGIDVLGISYLLEKMHFLWEFPIVGDIRSEGLLVGIDIVQDKKSKKPYPRVKKVTEKIIQTAMNNGLLLWYSTGHVNGTDGDVIMIGPRELEWLLDGLDYTSAHQRLYYRAVA